MKGLKKTMAEKKNGMKRKNLENNDIKLKKSKINSSN